jgi:Transmembrane secretion effector
MTKRLANASVLQPLRSRDFSLLVGASVVSLLGDGFFHLALTWLVYSISNVPTALSFVGVAATLPSVLFLLLGGAFSDRLDRRRLMISADLLRAAAIGVMAILAAARVIELWHIAALVALVAVGDAFFNPASTAIVPDLVADEQLPAANALAGMYRPLMVRLIGPAIAGFVVAAAGPAPAFAIDAASFVVSALAVWTIRKRPAPRPAADHGLRQTVAQVAEGMRFARATPWIWATLLAAMLSLLVFIGPIEVLVPYLVKNRLSLGPESLGAIFAVGGVGSIAMSVLIGIVGLPRRRVTVMYASFALGVAATASYGFMTALWQALLISFVLQASFQLGQVIWTTMLQQLVPRDLLGRVSSLDWLVSTGLVPVSFALTGPVSGVLGPETTIVGAGLIGAVLMGGLLFVPGVRDPERTADVRTTVAAASGGAE